MSSGRGQVCVDELREPPPRVQHVVVGRHDRFRRVGVSARVRVLLLVRPVVVAREDLEAASHEPCELGGGSATPSGRRARGSAAAAAPPSPIDSIVANTDAMRCPNDVRLTTTGASPVTGLRLKRLRIFNRSIAVLTPSRRDELAPVVSRSRVKRGSPGRVGPDQGRSLIDGEARPRRRDEGRGAPRSRGRARTPRAGGVGASR